ncbi:alanine/glycine:cation symporter family protein [Garicola koreensis]|uniref:AGCS family alanine or glycine:cation symporter n=1 Tax=Garicola koreensis TaxID=1262554 RepID=A0A7W5XLI2_9MICC|nr:alanine/glycine:cation symporter family protein [Garicola koreensis]MBB3668195.1 AGCS family alanine or glycine:cation symporter [Garicola koreensis]MBB3668201.1 AGCS family alanine or glycine:cation symporter [Garicola koreensis]
MNPLGHIAAMGAEEQVSGLQQVADTIDEVFGNATGFFVNLIFGTEVTVPLGAPFPEEATLWDGPLVVLWAVVAAISFTIYFKGVQFTGFKTSLEVIRGKYSRDDDPGEISHFQALTSALSATVGLGNIAGVAAAVSLGGPGATFWMVLAGLFGMCTKFVECTLGVRYRTIDADGNVHGGPFKYLPVAFHRLGKVPVAIITGVFAISIMLFGVIGGGMFQANQTYGAITSAGETIDAQTGGSTFDFLDATWFAFLFGIIFAGLVALVIIGGIKSIGAVTSKLIPIMAGIYVLGALIVILANIGNLGEAVGQIISGAFSPEGISGGVLGVIIIGVQRAAFSNEAGIGSAPIAHSAVKTRRPVSEGFVAALEPFIDTVVVCTMTALVIIFAWPADFEASIGVGHENPVGLTSNAFDSFIPGFSVVLAICVAMFAFSTLITWAYYGLEAWRYLFGKSMAGDMTFRLIVCVMIVIGCVVTFANIIDFADAALFLCIFINVIGLCILAPVVKKEMQQYIADRRAGRLMEDPEYIPGPEDMVHVPQKESTETVGYKA